MKMENYNWDRYEDISITQKYTGEAAYAYAYNKE